MIVQTEQLIKVLHVTDSISRLGGGLAPVVLGHALHQSKLGVDVAVLSARDDYTSEDLSNRNLTSVQVQLFREYGPRRFAFSPALRRALLKEDATHAVVHLHGIWSFLSVATKEWSHKKGGVHVVAPHGSLDDWALQHSAWKKSIAAFLCEKENLAWARCLHATTSREYDNIRNYGLKNPVCVVPNAIDLHEFDSLPDRGQFGHTFPETANKRVLLFLSRLHPKKGIPILLRAWNALAARREGWTLVIGGGEGPEARGHQQELVWLTRSLHIEDSVVFTGPLYGQVKKQAYAAADAFILPSLSEGFPMVLLEVLACRLPVLITHNCNFREVGEVNAGLITDADVEPLRDSLIKLFELSEEERRAMGQRGRALIESRYAWPSVASQMIAVYKWVLEGGPKPACVLLD